LSDPQLDRVTAPPHLPHSATVQRYPLGMDGVLTRVLEAGGGDRVITFIHGVGARCDRWTGNVEAMASAGHHAFAFDLPGHGFATKGDGFAYGIRAYADLVRTFLDTMGIRRSVLVGTSMGGHIAARVACDQPERVSGLVLVGTLGVVPMGPAHRAALSASLKDTSRQGIETKLRRLIHDDTRLVGERWITEEWRINNSPGAGDAFARLSEYFAGPVDDDVVGTLLSEMRSDIPTVLVWGEEDVMVPIGVLRECAEVLPHANIAVIAETSHAPYIERADAFHNVVLRAIEERWGPERSIRL
jgi:2-hydroxy-6-oxonona-2,4-dienedioate hydrolase